MIKTKEITVKLILTKITDAKQEDKLYNVTGRRYI
jgi:hypothetical protein